MSNSFATLPRKAFFIEPRPREVITTRSNFLYEVYSTISQDSILMNDLKIISDRIKSQEHERTNFLFLQRFDIKFKKEEI